MNNFGRKYELKCIIFSIQTLYRLEDIRVASENNKQVQTLNLTEEDTEAQRVFSFSVRVGIEPYSVHGSPRPAS